MEELVCSLKTIAWVQVVPESTLRPSHFAWEEAIGRAESIGAAYRASYPQLVHRSRPDLSTASQFSPRK